MNEARIVRAFESRLPTDDDHPYRTGAWTPNVREWEAPNLEVIGELPADLRGVYLRNTENPLLPAMERYHPFDGDGMLHALHFHDGQADYRSRFVRTTGLAAELEAGRPMWAGIMEDPRLSEHDGVGARTRMKDASSTDVIVHGGAALTSFYQCGDLYTQDAISLEPGGRFAATNGERWRESFGAPWGVSAHPKVDHATGELLLFNYSKRAPYMHVGVVDHAGLLTGTTAVPLPGPRLPHDMAFTTNYMIVNDFPLFWDEALLDKGVHLARMHDLPSRFGLIARNDHADAPGAVQWFEAPPTYCLHFANAWEEGDEVVLLGYPQSNPAPGREPGDGRYSMLRRYIDINALGTTLHEWRFNLRTGETRVRQLDDRVTEFPTIDDRFAGRENRYVFAMTAPPGWFLFDGLVRHDLQTGARQHYACPAGVYLSESPVAPRDTSGDVVEANGYVVTFSIDMNEDRSECLVFDASNIDQGPIVRVQLPERICSGTHATWASEAALRGSNA